MHPRIGGADRLERPQQRVPGADLVVPVGPDQQQMAHLGIRDHGLEEVERRGIQPLQIVEKQRERVLFPREHAEEAPENHLEAVLRVLWRQVRDRPLFADHELQLGNEVHHELTVVAQRLAQRVPPPAELRIALRQKRSDKALKGLGKRSVRDVAFVLVELAGREEPARRDERLVQLVDDRGLADPGIAGHEHQLGRARRHDTVERREQGVDLPLPAVQPLRHQQSVRRVVQCRAGTGRSGRATPIRVRQRRRSASTPAAVW